MDVPFEVRASSVHGQGLFAMRDVPKHARIGEYKGPLISHKEYDRTVNKDYMFQVSLGVGKSAYVDASGTQSLARYVNHSSVHPNAYAYQYNKKIYFRLLRPVQKNEEILIDYGKEYWASS